MYKTLILIFIVGVTGFLSYCTHFSAPGSQPVKITQEKQTPKSFAFTFKTIEGEEVELSSLKGKTVFINVWATWCAPCIIELPDLLKLAAKKPERVAVILLSVDQEIQNIEEFFDNLPEEIAPYTDLENVWIAHDPLKIISRDTLGITLYPETYILKPSLEIERKIDGIHDWLGQDIKQLIENHHIKETAHEQN